jgi:hypothetical protein
VRHSDRRERKRHCRKDRNAHRQPVRSKSRATLVEAVTVTFGTGDSGQQIRGSSSSSGAELGGVGDVGQDERALTSTPSMKRSSLAQLGTVRASEARNRARDRWPIRCTMTAMERSAVVVSFVLALASLWSCGGDSKRGEPGSDAQGGTSSGAGSTGGSTSADNTSGHGGSTSGGASQGGGGHGGNAGECGGSVNRCPADGTPCERPGEICSHCYFGNCGIPGCRSGAANGYYEGCECIQFGSTPRWRCCPFFNVSNLGCSEGDPHVDVCGLPSDSVPCEGDVQSYWHNPATGECEAFTYGGCQGNDNNFETLAACELACSDYVGGGGQGGDGGGS